MKKMKTEIDFFSLEKAPVDLEDGVENIPIDAGVNRSRFPRSFSSKDVFMRQRSSILHDLMMSLGFQLEQQVLEDHGKLWLTLGMERKKYFKHQLDIMLKCLCNFYYSSK